MSGTVGAGRTLARIGFSRGLNVSPMTYRRGLQQAESLKRRTPELAKVLCGLLDGVLAKRSNASRRWRDEQVQESAETMAGAVRTNKSGQATLVPAPQFARSTSRVHERGQHRTLRDTSHPRRWPGRLRGGCGCACGRERRSRTDHDHPIPRLGRQCGRGVRMTAPRLHRS